MSTLQQVIASIHSLDPAEKLVVRNFLEHELNAPSTTDVSPPSLIGLLSDVSSLDQAIQIVPLAIVVAALLWMLGARSQRHEHLSEAAPA